MVYFAEARAGSYAEYMLVHQTMLEAMASETVALVKDEDFRQASSLEYHMLNI